MDSQDAQTLAEKTYSDNIAYLQNEQSELYSKIVALDSALEQNLYENKYELLYEHGYFDVKEILANKYLYGSNSDEYAKTVAQSVNHDKKSNLFKTYKEIGVNEKNLDMFENMDIMQDPICGIASIFSYIHKNGDVASNMKRIEKFIFFGVGLGKHIVEVDKKIQSQVYFIVEDNLELFKLSLFVTPFSELAKNAMLIFSVFESSEEFVRSSSKFLYTKFEYNHYLKYFPMLNHNEEKLRDFHVTITSQSHNLFFYTSILKQYLRPLEYLSAKYKFLNILKNYSTQTLGQKPVLLLAAGPSLLKNIQWIKENQGKFLIVAVSATLIELFRHGIKPDIVTHLDGFDITTELFTRIKSSDHFKEILFLLSARTPKQIIDMLDKDNVFFFENGTNYKESFGNLSAPCVGSTTYLLFLAFDVKEMYLLGLDLALDAKTGYTHAKTHVNSKKISLNDADLHEDVMTLRNSIITHPSNFGEKAYTNPNFLISIDSINSTSVGFKKNYQNVYNLSDGVLFKNTTPVHVESVNTSILEMMNKKEIHENLLLEFEQNSNREFTKEEKDAVAKRYEYALRVKKILKKQQSMVFASDSRFLQSLKILYKDLTSDSSMKAHDLSLVYQEYFHLLNTYIFDFFNIRTENEMTSHANKINQLLCRQLFRIQSIYQEKLKKFI